MHHCAVAPRRNGARRGQWTAQAEQLLDLLNALGNTIFRQFLWQRSAELDLTYAQGQVLFHVAAHPGCRMGDVGKAFGVTLPAAAGCSDRASGTQRATAPPLPVLVAEAVRRDVPLDVSVSGTVQALTTGGVKSQVSGQVVKVNFTEGQDVKAEQLLFTIDPRPFAAAPAQAKANVRRDTAQIRQAG